MIKYYSKTILVTGFLFGISLMAVAQNTDDLTIVKADSIWGKEIIEFPIEWAPKLALEGFEELRFAPNWSNKEHDNFWSLVMSWNIKADTQLSLNELELNFEYYFDGLMKPNHWAKEFPEPDAEFFASEETENGMIFKGKMTFFDGFYTGKLITVYILGQQIHCETVAKSIIIFKISSKEYTEPIWDKLKIINVKADVCDN